MHDSKALQVELARMGAAHTYGRFDDPNADVQTAFHLFLPGTSLPSQGVVLFHGTGNDALFCWENLILDLLKSGRAVFTFDLPGHGQGSQTILNEASFASCGMFLPILLPRLLPGLQSMAAIGYSLGALAALQLAAQGTMSWQSLVLMALPKKVEMSAAFIWNEALSFFQKSWWQQLLHYGWDASFPAFGPVRRSRFPIRMDPAIRMSYPDFVGHLLEKTDVVRALGQLGIPALLIYGSRDHLATPDYGQTLSSTSQRVQGANHFLLPLAPATRSLLLNWLLTSPQHPAESSVPR
jgi:pimeloyl-ACP methyl ester carboxylesterase